MTVEISTYESKFQDAVVDLWKTCNLITPQNDPVEDIRKKTSFQPELFFVGLLEGKVIGSIMVGYEGHRGWMNYMAVNPKYQRQGYGRKLVQKAIAELKKIGCVKINLQVRRSNTSVIDFYKHLEFQEDDVISLAMRLK